MWVGCGQGVRAAVAEGSRGTGAPGEILTGLEYVADTMLTCSG
jgi:hypothetical protein